MVIVSLAALNVMISHEFPDSVVSGFDSGIGEIFSGFMLPVSMIISCASMMLSDLAVLPVSVAPDSVLPLPVVVSPVLVLHDSVVEPVDESMMILFSTVPVLVSLPDSVCIRSRIVPLSDARDCIVVSVGGFGSRIPDTIVRAPVKVFFEFVSTGIISVVSSFR